MLSGGGRDAVVAQVLDGATLTGLRARALDGDGEFVTDLRLHAINLVGPKNRIAKLVKGFDLLT